MVTHQIFSMSSLQVHSRYTAKEIHMSATELMRRATGECVCE